jgi:hypothetical protein
MTSPLYETGQLIEGKGVYLGPWEPKDRHGRLGRIFDVYAAPEDLKGARGDFLQTFNDAVTHVAGLRNFHGHDGGDLASEDAVLEAAYNNPAALGNWFIPTKDLLHGETIGGERAQPANLYDSAETGAFRNSFITNNGSGHALWYWSCTEVPDHPYLVYNVDFKEGLEEYHARDDYEMSCRVVRAELRL